MQERATLAAGEGRTCREAPRLHLGALYDHERVARRAARRGISLAPALPIGYAAAMADIVVRRAEQRDLPELGKLGAQLVRVHHGFDPQRFLAPEPDIERGYAWFLGTELENEDAVVFVAERGAPGEQGQIVGYVYAGVEPRSWKELREEAGFVHDVVVADAAREGGVGTRLLELAADWLKARGVPRVMLWTAERNVGAQRLFERLGFRRTMIEMTREV